MNLLLDVIISIVQQTIVVCHSIKLSVHEGKKPNKCDFWDVAFYLNVNLEQHVTAIHEERKLFKSNI